MVSFAGLFGQYSPSRFFFLADRLREQMEAKLRGQSVTIAVDGGTIHKKLQAVCFLAQKQVYFFKCCKVLHNDHATILSVLELAKTNLDKLGALCVAVVGDNHSGVQKVARFSVFSYFGTPVFKAIDLFCEKFPRVFKIRCVAHSLQLLMNDLYQIAPMHEACRLAQAV